MTFFKTLIAVMMLAAPAHAARIKFATFAPEGTDAMKIMRLIDEDIQKATGGKLKFKFYAGGKQGDEKDVVRKIRIGQLHSGGFTGVGLGEIAPMVRILDAPWLFHDTAEIDHIHEIFDRDFEAAFAKKGYLLLGWAEVGPVHIFSNKPVRTVDDLKQLDIWVWEGDPIAEAAFAAVGVHPKPLSIADVNTSLQTGHVDSVYSAPLYAIALQWHEKTKYVFTMPLANATGAVLLSKRFYDRLPKDQQDILLTSSRKHLKTLNGLTREKNRAALETLKKHGLTFTDPASEQVVAEFENAGRTARRKLIGRLYSKELLDRVEAALAKFRANRLAKKDKKR